MEFRKTIFEEDNTVPTAKVTYIGVAEYQSNLNPDGYSTATDTWRPIRKIKKITETTVWTVKTTEALFPIETLENDMLGMTELF